MSSCNVYNVKYFFYIGNTKCLVCTNELCTRCNPVLHVWFFMSLHLWETLVLWPDSDLFPDNEESFWTQMKVKPDKTGWVVVLFPFTLKRSFCLCQSESITWTDASVTQWDFFVGLNVTISNICLVICPSYNYATMKSSDCCVTWSKLWSPFCIFV